MIDPTELTEDQLKAWKSLQRAFKKCKNSNIFFYQVLDTLSPLNGNVVSHIEESPTDISSDDAFYLSDTPFTREITLGDQFSDDQHYAILK